MRFSASKLIKETGESLPDDIVSYDDVCEHLLSLSVLFGDNFAKRRLIVLASLRIGESCTCKTPNVEASATRIA